MLVKRHLLNRLVLASLVVSGCLSAAPAVTFAQEAAANYTSLPPEAKYKDPKALKELDEPKRAALRGSYNEDAIKKYYRNVTIPQLTSLGDTQEVNAAVTAIRADMAQAEKMDAASLKAYNKFLFLYLSGVVRGIKNQQFRPSASINAVLLIGDLNDAPGSGRNPPQPYAGAAEFLMEMAEKGSSDGIKAAALVGLERNIRIQKTKLSDQARSALATKLLNLAKAPIAAGQNSESHAYLSSRYLQLAQLFPHDKSADLVAFATDTLANEFTHPILREQALSVVGRYDIPEDQKPKLVAAGRYSMRYMKERLERWNELYGRNISASGGGGGGPMGPGGAYGGSYAASAGPQGAGAGGMGSYGAGSVQQQKPESKFEKQSQETKMLRRYALEIVQTMRFGLTGETKLNDKVDAPYEKVDKGLLSKLPEGDERDLTKHAMTLMDELVEAINSDEIESKTDFQTKEIPTKVKNLIAIAEEYPGALDVENEAIIIEPVAEPAVAPPAADAAAAAAATPANPTDPTVGVQVTDPPAPAGN